MWGLIGEPHDTQKWIMRFSSFSGSAIVSAIAALYHLCVQVEANHFVPLAE